MKKTAYFISDAHLGTYFKQHEERETNLITFLHEIEDHTSHLFIVGDLFDFWIEYKHAIRPIYFPILHEFRRLIEKGVEIHYLAGNHDFALGPFLEQTIGIHIHPWNMTTTLQGKRIYLRHGDGILRFDYGYRFWRALLRNRVNQALYKLLHPNIGVPLATFFSGSSRYFNATRLTQKRKKEYIQVARTYLNQGNDIVIFGHTHAPKLYDFNGKFYCNTGDWIKQYSYAKLEAGQLTLWRYLPGKAASQIESMSSK